MTTSNEEIYIPANAAEIRDDLLTDIRLEGRQQPDIDSDELDRAVLPGSDWYILATALANVALIQYSNLRIADSNTDVRTASGKSLDDKRVSLGLPEVPANGSSGNIVIEVTAGAPTLPDGTEFVLPNGKRGAVDGLHLGLSDGDEVAVYTIDTGNDTNLNAGEAVQFISPPAGIATEAIVSSNSPLTGGTDKENDERKRQRIINRMRNVPAGGNWGHKVEVALNSLSTVQMAFIYPALGGPGSEKVAIARALDPEDNVLTRELSSSAVGIVRDAIHEEFGAPFEIVVQSVADQTADVAIQITVPDAVASGGNGEGWIDATPWPQLVGAETHTPITAITSSAVFTVDADTVTAPVTGQTHLAWWSPAEQKFYVGLIIGQSGGTGAWVITLDHGLADVFGNAPAVGDYVSPVALYTEDYGATWLNSLNSLGPGENTTDANRLPRALRHPFVGEEWPSSLNMRQLTELAKGHPEISDLEWSYRSLSTPTVPASVATAPNIIVCRHFGIYKQ